MKTGLRIKCSGCFEMSAPETRLGITLRNHLPGCMVTSVSDSSGAAPHTATALARVFNSKRLIFAPPPPSPSPSPVFVGVPLKLNDVIVQVNGAEVRDISRIEAIFAQGDHSAPPPPPSHRFTRFHCSLAVFSYALRIVRCFGRQDSENDDLQASGNC
jgi:hypothetical protein